MQKNIQTVKKIAILTSGGDAPGMNAAIRAIVIAAQHYHLEVTGFYAGFNGLIDDVSVPLGLKDVSHIIHRGGTILKSARCPAMETTLGIAQATSTLLKAQIDALIVIGGDGSFTGLIALQKQWSGQVIGIPGTIDNDIDGTDFTILAKEIKQAQANRHASYIIVLAENLWRGGASALAQQLQTIAKIDCTPCILGHVQRGGSPVAKDRILATKMGVAAVQAIISGQSNIMIAEQSNTIAHVALPIAIMHQQGVSESLVQAQENILALTAQHLS